MKNRFATLAGIALAVALVGSASTARADLPPPDGQRFVDYEFSVAGLAAHPDWVLLAFPWHDHADRLLGGYQSGEFPIQADEDPWTALVEGWWGWVKADGPLVYVAECDGDALGRIRRAHKLARRGPGLVAVDNVEFSWSRVPRVAYDRAWQDAIDACRAGWPSPVGEWISETPGDRRLHLSF